MTDGTSVEALTQGFTSARTGAPGIDPAPAALAHPQGLRHSALLLLCVAIGVSAYVLHGQGSPALAISLLVGAAFGIVLQRARFCFFACSRMVR